MKPSKNGAEGQQQHAGESQALGLGMEAVRKAGPVITEHANLLLDIRFPEAIDPADLEDRIGRIPGVVESGFFTRKRPIVFIARSDGTVEQR